MRGTLLPIPLLLFVGSFSGVASAEADLTLKETLRLAIRNNPLTEADKFRELASDKDITRARAAYYPRVNLMALETTGFPGSAAATGVGGLMVSPFHKGATGGLLLEQEIFDFGRTSAAVTVAKKRSDVARAESKVRALQIGAQAAKFFADCAKHRSLADIFEKVVQEAKSVQKEVERFVSTGQRSIVDRYLSQSHTEEAVTSAAVYADRLIQDKEQLRVLLVQDTLTSACPAMSEKVATEFSGGSEKKSVSSPLLLHSQSEVSLSESEVSRSRADYYPRLVGMASLGVMQDSELNIPIKNYSAAVALIFPLFEGFKTDSEVEAGLARNMQREKELNAVKLKITEANLAYDEEIQAAKIRMQHLRHEFELAETAFSVAKKRYIGRQGTLVDVREALRNWTRIQVELKEAESLLLIKSAEKGLLNGDLLEQVAS